MSAELETNSKVVLSADVVGSTALYESFGDTRAKAMVNDCLAALKAYCAEHHGQSVAEIGDQLVAVFADPTDATSTASEIHAHLHEQSGKEAGERIRLRIGLHYGPLPPGGPILGSQTAKIADWASGKAKPEQTLATGALIEQLPRIFRAVSRYVDDETWDFVSLEHVQLHEVIWDVESITAFNGEMPARDDNTYNAVIFTHGGQTLRVDTARPVISIGRQSENDLVVDQDLVSRQHLSAQFSRGRCTITDNSTNGSTIRLDDGSEYELKRESFRLVGSGVVVPGMPEGNAAAFEIRFRCE